MKQSVCMVGLGLALCVAPVQGALISWNVDAAIPDNTESGLQDTQTVEGFTDVIGMLEVWLKISAVSPSAAWNGDLYVTLQHASGFAVLLNRVGRTDDLDLGYSDNGMDLTFTLGAVDVHNYQNDSPSFDLDGRLTGTWGVDGRNVDPVSVLNTSPRSDMLSSFTGLDPNGTWTLFVADMNQNGVAQLDSWGINVTPIPEPGTLSLLALGGLLLRRRKPKSMTCPVN